MRSVRGCFICRIPHRAIEKNLHEDVSEANRKIMELHTSYLINMENIDAIFIAEGEHYRFSSEDETTVQWVTCDD